MMRKILSVASILLFLNAQTLAQNIDNEKPTPSFYDESGCPLLSLDCDPPEDANEDSKISTLTNAEVLNVVKNSVAEIGGRTELGPSGRLSYFLPQNATRWYADYNGTSGELLLKHPMSGFPEDKTLRDAVIAFDNAVTSRIYFERQHSLKEAASKEVLILARPVQQSSINTGSVTASIFAAHDDLAAMMTHLTPLLTGDGEVRNQPVEKSTPKRQPSSYNLPSEGDLPVKGETEIDTSKRQVYLNETLIEDTATFSSAAWQPTLVRERPDYGERITLSPQNRGVLLYADHRLAIFNRGNVRVNEIKPNGRSVSVLIPEADVCQVQTTHVEWAPGGIQYTGPAVDIPKMHVVVVVNTSPRTEIDKAWIEAEIKPLIEAQIFDRFCGGKIASVRADIWIAGLQHSVDGRIFNIASFAYPEFTVGDDLRGRYSFELASPNGSLRIRPFNASFASVSFNKWEKLSASERRALEQMGFDVGDGNQLDLSLGYGVSEYAQGGRIITLNKKWDRLSYSDYSWHLAQKAKRNIRIEQTRDSADDLFAEYISAIVNTEDYCWSSDAPWWLPLPRDRAGRPLVENCNQYSAKGQ